MLTAAIAFCDLCTFVLQIVAHHKRVVRVLTMNPTVGGVSLTSRVALSVSVVRPIGRSNAPVYLSISTLEIKIRASYYKKVNS